MKDTGAPVSCVVGSPLHPALAPKPPTKTFRSSLGAWMTRFASNLSRLTTQKQQPSPPSISSKTGDKNLKITFGTVDDDVWEKSRGARQRKS
ncbi:hypothetical protein AAFF_G00289930, partial [Aldrovandia affinis]